MSGPTVGGRSGTHRIEVDVSDEFQEVGLLFYQGILKPVLEEVTGATVHAVEAGGVRTQPTLGKTRQV